MSDPSFSHEYPPSGWTATGIADALESAGGTPPVPTYEDEETWETIREDPACAPVVDAIIAEAETALETEPPAYPASLFLEYTRGEGVSQRRVMEPTLDRARRLSVTALAECFEREGRFEDAILDTAWALTEQATWLHPANLSAAQEEDGLPVDVPAPERNVALRPAGIATAFGELDYVFGERLHPALRDRMRDAVEQRVLDPYEARDDFWWMDPPANNWNAVCNAGAAMAAMYLWDDPDRVGRLVAKAVHNMEYYVDEFDADGCTPEGIGYWNYGFGNYVQFAAQLEALTGGEYSLLSPPVVSEIAQFPLRIELSPGRFPAFSDAQEVGEVGPFTACWLGHRLDLPGLAARGRAALSASSVGRFPDTLRHLLWAQETPADASVPAPEPRSFFDGHDWWVARADPGVADGLVVAAKGGHNAESHNHNDVGTFVVHHERESLLTDLGAPVYDNEFFGDDRYEYLAARSLGHNVPYVNGHEQAAGREYGAEVVDRSEAAEGDSVTVDLAGCYPEAARVDSLRRTLTLDRERAEFTVEDRATFDGDGEFETVFVSYAPIEDHGDHLAVTGDDTRASVVPEAASGHEVERLEGAIDKSESDGFEEEFPDVWRARITAGSGGDADATARYIVRPE